MRINDPFVRSLLALAPLFLSATTALLLSPRANLLMGGRGGPGRAGGITIKEANNGLNYEVDDGDTVQVAFKGSRR